MKRSLLLVCVVALSAIMPSPAVCAPPDWSESYNEFKPMRHPMLLSITYGRRFNLGGNENPDWFGRQRLTHSDLTFRLGVFALYHWGFYGNLSFGGADDWVPPIGPNWRDEGFCGLSLPSAAASAGVMYRYESKRWQCFARVGYGSIFIGHASLEGWSNMHLEEPEQTSSIIESSEWKANKVTGTTYVDFGLTVGYRTSRTVSLVFDVNYHLPVANRYSHVWISQTVYPDNNQAPMKNEWYFTSKSWGNNLTVSLGVQFQCDLSGSAKKKHKSYMEKYHDAKRVDQ